MEPHHKPPAQAAHASPAAYAKHGRHHAEPHHKLLLLPVPLLLLVIRPLAVYAGLVGAKVERSQRRLIAWFGIRGIGSIYYLMYAITHDLHPVIAQRLLAITLAVVVASVLLHGVSVTPLMRRYETRRKTKAQRPR